MKRISRFMAIALVLTATMAAAQLTIPSGKVTKINRKTGRVTVASSKSTLVLKFESAAQARRLNTGDKLRFRVVSKKLWAQRGSVRFGPLSWACTGDWKECWCNKGSDCDAICKGPITCPNPDVPDECTCAGDAGKGGSD